jgi:hypothetical protein
MIDTVDNGLVSDSFEITQGAYTLRDALVMPSDQYAALSADEIAAMKQARFDNWYAIVTAPPVEEPPVTDSQTELPQG